MDKKNFMLFDSIFTHINKIITTPSYLYMTVPYQAYKYSIIANNRDMSKQRASFENFDKFNITIIKILNEEMYLNKFMYDSFLFNNKVNIVIEFNDQIILKLEFDQLVKNIHDMFKFIIDTIKPLYIGENKSTMKTIFDVAADILAFKFISMNNIIPYNDLIDITQCFKLDKDKLFLSNKYSIQILLDNFGIIPILENDEKRLINLMSSGDEDIVYE